MLTQYNATCLASESYLYADNSIAHVLGKCLLRPLIDKVCSFICDESQPESRLNYICSPGSHTVKSPVVGSRVKQRKAIKAKVAKEPVLAEFESQVLSTRLISKECKKVADKAADQIYSIYIDRYRYCGVNETNAIMNINQILPRTLYIYDRSAWRVDVSIGIDLDNFMGASYLPPGLAKTRALMLLEETAPFAEMEERQAGDELISSLTTLLYSDEIVKKCLNIKLEDEVDYYKEINSIPVGKVANFYRALANRVGSVAEAILSPESIDFLTKGDYFIKIDSHVKLALQGRLEKKNPFAAHLAFLCKGEECNSVGTLGRLNGLPAEHRTYLAAQNRITCPFTTYRINDDEVKQSLSSTVFGIIPKRLQDICHTLFMLHLMHEEIYEL